MSSKILPRIRKLILLALLGACFYAFGYIHGSLTRLPAGTDYQSDAKHQFIQQTQTPSIPRDHASGKLIPIFNDPDRIVSQIRVVKDDLLEYHVCRYENVCVSPNETLLFTTTSEAAAELEMKYSKCYKKSRSSLSALDRKFCDCFSVQVGYRFFAQDPQRPLPAFETIPTYLIYNWLPHHHLSHFAFSTVHFHSVLQHQQFYSLPKFKRVIFQDLPPDGLTDYEKAMWDIILAGGKLESLQEIQFLRRNASMQCYKSIYSSKQSEVYARSKADIDVFKKSAEKVLGLDITNRECPPSRTLLLVRSNGTIQGNRMRTMVNQWHVMKLLEKKGLTQVDVLDMNGTMSLRDQAHMISRYGLIISSHSSQLTNLLFAHNNAAVMEVGIIYKPAFRNLGLMARTFYINSVGHKPERVGYWYRGFYPRISRECNFTRMAQGDVSSCPMSTKEIEAMKNSDYRVHLEYFEKDLDLALNFLEGKCWRSAGWIL
ncbi:hypothetical protein BDR26DRAFT_860333 [Obelidium mucronatum]|nr:hypothetical protein BDR26DRAFT_860333 [Obelidium mucronatum]